MGNKLDAGVAVALACLLGLLSVLAALPADAQTARRDRTLIEPVYREPVLAPRKVVPGKRGKAQSIAKGRGRLEAGSRGVSRRNGSVPPPAVAKAARTAAAATSSGSSSSTAQGETVAAAAAPSAASTGSAVTPPPQVAKTDATPSATSAIAAVPMTMDQFLDRLMIAESGGRLDVKNPRSTALGPFQFIESTFIAVVRRNFAAEVTDKSAEQILALRTNLAFARKAAEAYTRENAAVLKSYDVEPSYPNLRLAFLLGAQGAAKVLKAAPATPLSQLLAPAVLVANPFMASLTAHGLAIRSAREVWQPVHTTQGVTVPPGTPLPRRIAAAPIVPIVCNIRLPSCKRWVALQTAKVRGRPLAKTKSAQAAGKKISDSLSNLGGPKAGPR